MVCLKLICGLSIIFLSSVCVQSLDSKLDISMFSNEWEQPFIGSDTTSANITLVTNITEMDDSVTMDFNNTTPSQLSTDDVSSKWLSTVETTAGLTSNYRTDMSKDLNFILNSENTTQSVIDLRESIQISTDFENITIIDSVSDVNHTMSANNETAFEYVLDYEPVLNNNETDMNSTKTIEDLFEEENREFNISESVLTVNTTELNDLINSSFVTYILPAIPGIPVFKDPPQIKIHDPDEGPIEPYHHPSNDSNFPTTETPGQKFIYMKRPEFVPEKGSLEETYKHLLVDAEEDDITLSPDLEEFVAKTDTPNVKLSSSTVLPLINKYLPTTPCLNCISTSVSKTRLLTPTEPSPPYQPIPVLSPPLLPPHVLPPYMLPPYMLPQHILSSPVLQPPKLSSPFLTSPVLKHPMLPSPAIPSPALQGLVLPPPAISPSVQSNPVQPSVVSQTSVLPSLISPVAQRFPVPLQSTVSPLVLQPPLYPSPVLSPVMLPYPYGYPYFINPYLYAQYMSQLYRQGTPGIKGFPYIPEGYLGYVDPVNEKEKELTFNPKTEEIETQTEINQKLLPKSYNEFGAFIAHVSLDEKQGKEVGQGDAGTLEQLGPIEWLTTPLPTTTTVKEIKFIINPQNNNRNAKTQQKVPTLTQLTKNIRPIKTSGPDINPELLINSDEKLDNSGAIGRISHRKTNYTRVAAQRNGQQKRLNEQRIDQNIPESQVVFQFNSTTKDNPQTDKIRIHNFGNENHNKSGQQIGIDQTHLKNDSFSLATTEKISHADEPVDGEPVPIPNTDWKQTNKPKFLMRAKIRPLDQLKVDEITGIIWWRQEQPNYCTDAIYIVSSCADPEPTKRWSFDSNENTCYLYEDLCPQSKANSFETSQECFRKCYRVKT